MAAETTQHRTFTPKGEAARGRILDVAADLFYERGIGGTTNDDIRTAAQVSGSQLNHYFPTRAALVEAVLAKRIADAVDPELFPGSGLPHSLASLRGWADVYLERYERLTGGCRVGSLAAETLKSSIDLREQLADAYERWRMVLRDGLQQMKDAGELTEAADADYLSLVLLTALQGGLLLSQIQRDTHALEIGLDTMLAHIASYQPSSDPVRPKGSD